MNKSDGVVTYLHESRQVMGYDSKSMRVRAAIGSSYIYVSVHATLELGVQISISMLQT